MTPDQQILSLAAELEPSNEKAAKVLRELLSERRATRLRTVELLQARDFFKQQTELKDLFHG